MRLIRAAIICCLTAAGLAGCGNLDDVAFARRVLAQLIEGRYAARGSLDWTRLMALETNVGSDYVSLPNDKQRADFQRAFIDGFRKGFRQSGATIRSFVHWRVFNDADPSTIYVAADNKDGSGTLIFAVAKEQRKRSIVWIRLVGVKDRDAYQKFEEEQRHVLQKK